jgi:hypothetical protein
MHSPRADPAQRAVRGTKALSRIVTDTRTPRGPAAACSFVEVRADATPASLPGVAVRRQRLTSDRLAGAPGPRCTVGFTGCYCGLR